MMVELKDGMLAEEQGKTVNDLLSSPEYTARNWSKSYLEEWARYFLILRFISNTEKSNPRSTVLDEFITDTLTSITFRDQGKEESAYETMKNGLERLPLFRDKGYKSKIISLMNLITVW